MASSSRSRHEALLEGLRRADPRPEVPAGGGKREGLAFSVPPQVVVEHSKRAAVSIVLRVRPEAGTAAAAATAPSTSAPLDVQQFLRLDWVRRGRLEVLFVKRAVNAGDRWSGQVAFPGGRQANEGEAIDQVAVRETLEEVGLDLADRSSFAPLVRLDDEYVMALRGSSSLVVSVFVFVQVVPVTPPLALEQREVSNALWCPLELFVTRPLNWLYVRLHFPTGNLKLELPETPSGPMPTTYPPPLSTSVRIAGVKIRRAMRHIPRPGTARFPAMCLPGSRYEVADPRQHGRDAASAPSVVRMRELPAEISVDARDADAFLLWGLSLRFTLRLLSRAGFPEAEGEYDLLMGPVRAQMALYNGVSKFKDLVKEGWSLRSRI